MVERLAKGVAPSAATGWARTAKLTTAIQIRYTGVPIIPGILMSGICSVWEVSKPNRGYIADGATFWIKSCFYKAVQIKTLWKPPPLGCLCNTCHIHKNTLQVKVLSTMLNMWRFGYVVSCNFALYAFRKLKFCAILPVMLCITLIMLHLFLSSILGTSHGLFYGLTHVVDLSLPSIFEPSLIPWGS